MFDANSGSLDVGSENPKISPFLHKDQFLSSKLGANSDCVVSNEPWNTYEIQDVTIDGHSFVITLVFKNEMLVCVNLYQILDPKSTSWAAHSEEVELARKSEHDKLLKSFLGDPPYSFKWGQIESLHDSRQGASEIIVRYHH